MTRIKAIFLMLVLYLQRDGIRVVPCNCPTNISGQKWTWVASFMLPLGLDYVKSNVNVMLMVAELNY